MKLRHSLSLILLFNVYSICPETNSSQNNEKQKPLQLGKEAMKPENKPSQLKSEIITPAKDQNAKSPQKGRPVTVHYTGWLQDLSKEDGKGKKFDSSIDRGTPFSFVIGVGQVIRGWDEGVINMKVGEKRRLIIPSELGYGSRGAGALIPPHATLIFEVELLEVS